MAGANVRSMAKTAIGSEPLVGSLVPFKKRDYKVTNKLQEGKRPLYAVAFNFIDSRYFNVFATVGGNRVTFSLSLILLFEEGFVFWQVGFVKDLVFIKKMFFFFWLN